MASNYTEHYDLCQWEATDQVQRTDFNADNAKLDTLLTVRNCQIYMTSYQGKGEGVISLTFPHKPMIVIIMDGNLTWICGIQDDVQDIVLHHAFPAHRAAQQRRSFLYPFRISAQLFLMRLQPGSERADAALQIHRFRCQDLHAAASRQVPSAARSRSGCGRRRSLPD